jgi:flagellar biosynthesis protein
MVMKKKKAAALQYRPGTQRAPRLVASGEGHIAEKILEIAGEREIPVYEDEKLADQLSALALGEEIPYELYEAVAGVLAFIARIDQEEAR